MGQTSHSENYKAHTSLTGKVIQRSGFEPGLAYIETEIIHVGDTGNFKGGHFEIIWKRWCHDQAEHHSALILIIAIIEQGCSEFVEIFSIFI